MKSRVASISGLLVFLLAWEAVARTGWLSTALPSITDIVGVFDRTASRALFFRAFNVTATSALLALCVAASLAVASALLVALLPSLDRGIDVIASGIYAVPSIAFGPVLILLAGPQITPVVLGTLSAYFPIYVAISSQLRYGNPARRQLAHVVGATRGRAFALIDVPASIPAFVDGLRLAAPAAILGTVLGEWFGAPRGLGVIIVSALQNVQVPQMWAAAVLCVGCSLLAYVLLTALHRRAVARFAF
jgi:NitT/TauT family transport system permease protein